MRQGRRQLIWGFKQPQQQRPVRTIPGRQHSSCCGVKIKHSLEYTGACQQQQQQPFCSRASQQRSSSSAGEGAGVVVQQACSLQCVGQTAM